MMEDAYAINLIPLVNSDELWLTVDVPDINSGMIPIVVEKYTTDQLDKANKHLKELRKKYRLIKNPFVRSFGTTQEERKAMGKMKKEGKDFRRMLMDRFNKR